MADNPVRVNISSVESINPSTGIRSNNTKITEGGGLFTPSSYTGTIASVEAGATITIATGAKTMRLQCLGLTSTANYAMLAFGTSAADAQTNLTKTGTTPNIISTSGVVIRSGVTDVVQPADMIVAIPSTATHAALGNGVAATPLDVMITQGV